MQMKSVICAWREAPTLRGKRLETVHAGWTSCMSRGRGWRSPCCPKSLSTINGQNFCTGLICSTFIRWESDETSLEQFVSWRGLDTMTCPMRAEIWLQGLDERTDRSNCIALQTSAVLRCGILASLSST